MKKIIVCLTAAVCFFVNILNAQNCPKISISSPASVKEGDDLMFIANVSGGDLNLSFTYNWSVSAGTIESGQGTSAITVNTKGLGGQTATATAELGGFPAGCVNYSSTTTSIEVLPPQTELHTKGNYTSAKFFTDSLNAFAGDFLSGYYINTYPKAVIFLYPGKTATSSAAITAMTKNIKAIFAKKKLFNYSIVKAGKRAQTSYEMWIVPAGEKEPVPSPAH